LYYLSEINLVCLSYITYLNVPSWSFWYWFSLNINRKRLRNKNLVTHQLFYWIGLKAQGKIAFNFFTIHFTFIRYSHRGLSLLWYLCTFPSVACLTKTMNDKCVFTDWADHAYLWLLKRRIESTCFLKFMTDLHHTSLETDSTFILKRDFSPILSQKYKTQLFREFRACRGFYRILVQGCRGNAAFWRGRCRSSGNTVNNRRGYSNVSISRN